MTDEEIKKLIAYHFRKIKDAKARVIIRRYGDYTTIRLREDTALIRGDELVEPKNNSPLNTVLRNFLAKKKC